MSDLDQNIKYIGPRHIHMTQVDPDRVAFCELNRELFRDKIVVIIGGGPSHADIDTKLLNDVNFIAVNSACRKVLNVVKEDDILYFSDNSWCESYNDLVRAWDKRGKVLTSNRNSKAKYQDLLYRINLTPIVEWFQVKADCIYVSSGHIATALAGYLGAKKIVLIGFECGLVEGRSHGHEDYSAHTVGMYSERYIPDWNSLAPRFEELGIEIINATPESYLKCFKYQEFEKAIML